MTAESNELLDGGIVSEDKKPDSVPSESRESGLTSLEKALEEAEGRLFSAAHRKNLVDGRLNDFGMVFWCSLAGILFFLMGFSALLSEDDRWNMYVAAVISILLGLILFVFLAWEMGWKLTKATIKQFPKYFELKDSQAELAEEISKHSNEIQRLKELIVDSSRRSE